MITPPVVVLKNLLVVEPIRESDSKSSTLTTVLSTSIVPDVVIVPPLNPSPAVMEVTVPEGVPEPSMIISLPPAPVPRVVVIPFVPRKTTPSPEITEAPASAGSSFNIHS